MAQHDNEEECKNDRVLHTTIITIEILDYIKFDFEMCNFA